MRALCSRLVLPGLTLVFVLMLLLLGACTPTATATPTPVLPDCLPEDLLAPTNLLVDGLSSETDEVVISSLSPTFTWEYEGGCTPGGFQIVLFQPHPQGYITLINEAVPGTSTSIVLSTPLTAGSFYTWRVVAIADATEGPASMDAFFLTGPECMDPYASEYPAPLLITPEDGAFITEGSLITFADGSTTPTVTFQMIWDDPAACLPVDGYLVQVSDDASFPDDIAHTLTFQQNARTFMLFFFPPGSTWVECVPYYWRVQADLPGSVEGPYSAVRTFTFNTLGADCSAVPAAPSGRVIQDGACRLGPTLDHRILDYPLSGDVLTLRGRNLESTWWWVFDERIQRECWISGKLVEVTGETNGLPVVQAPPPEVNLNTTETPAALIGCWVQIPNTQNWKCVTPCPGVGGSNIVCSPP